MARAAPARDQTVHGQHTSRGSTRARAAARRGWTSDQRSRRPTTRRSCATTAGCRRSRSRCSCGWSSTGGQRRPLPVGTRFADAAPRLPPAPTFLTTLTLALTRSTCPNRSLRPCPWCSQSATASRSTSSVNCFSKAASHQVRPAVLPWLSPGSALARHLHSAPHSARSARVHRGASCARSRASSRRFSRRRRCTATTTHSTPSCTTAWSPARSPRRARSRFSRCSACARRARPTTTPSRASSSRSWPTWPSARWRRRTASTSPGATQLRLARRWLHRASQRGRLLDGRTREDRYRYRYRF